MADPLPLAIQGLLRMQSWISPAFPIGSYSYSHGIEWAVEAGDVFDRGTLVDWLEADLCYGSGWNEGVLFMEAWRLARDNNRKSLIELVELASAFRATSEFALEASQQGSGCLATLRQVWPNDVLDWLLEKVEERHIRPTLAIVLGIRTAQESIPCNFALPAFLHGYIANLVIAGVRLIPLGQTDGQAAIAALERAVLAVSAEIGRSSMDDLGSSAFMVDLASMAHENQYTRLFRS